MLLTLLTWLSGLPVPLVKKHTYWTRCCPRSWVCVHLWSFSWAVHFNFGLFVDKLCTADPKGRALNTLIAPKFSVAFMDCGKMNSSCESAEDVLTPLIQPALISWTESLHSGLCVLSHYQSHGWMNIRTALDVTADTLRGDGKTIGCMFLYRFLGTVSLLTKRLHRLQTLSLSQTWCPQTASGTL